MASKLLDVIKDNVSVMSELTDDAGPAWHLLEDAFREAVYNENHALSYHDAWEIVHKSEYEVPDLEELGIASGSVLDALVKCAERAAEAKDYDDTESERKQLEDVMDELSSDGYSVWRIEIGTTSLGFLSHAWEREEYDGVLYHWNDVEGSGPADVLRLQLEDGALWLHLKKNEDEDEEDADDA